MNFIKNCIIILLSLLCISCDDSYAQEANYSTNEECTCKLEEIQSIVNRSVESSISNTITPMVNKTIGNVFYEVIHNVIEYNHGGSRLSRKKHTLNDGSVFYDDHFYDNEYGTFCKVYNNHDRVCCRPEFAEFTCSNEGGECVANVVDDSMKFGIWKGYIDYNKNPCVQSDDNHLCRLDSFGEYYCMIKYSSEHDAFYGTGCILQTDEYKMFVCE